MTNKDKYLKDGVDEDTIDDLAVEMVRFFDDEFRKIDSKRFTSVVPTFITKFFAQPLKPTLTEDEKVILRHINKDIYTIIGFDRNGLYLHNNDVASSREYSFYDMFGDLFQFIKERRRI